MTSTLDWLCRDCLAAWQDGAGTRRCPACGSRRTVGHRELNALSIAHLDCDAFYCAVEKRDNPDLAERPVVVGGGRRGVVSAACYVARLYGVRSAMPMFKALKACPDAVVIRPDMRKYAEAGRAVRALMRDKTPMVEPLSIDEAFLDLTGTERLHHGPPARTLADLVLRIEREVGVTASIGLSYNKSLAKVASDLDKPRGFAIIGRAEATSFLEPQPISLIWGVGKAMQARLNKDGVTTIGQLQRMDEERLRERYGAIGGRLYRFARGMDARAVNPRAGAKSLSSETTLNHDLADEDQLSKILWRLSEKVSARLKDKDLAGRTVHLKLKTSGFRIMFRSRTLGTPTQLAETMFQAASPLLGTACDGRSFRLIGIGVSDLVDAAEADLPDLAEPHRREIADVERAIDAVRAKLGDDAITKGRAI